MAEPREGYSPHLRTALLFTGTGTAGAYHVGVLQALQEAGVKIDIVGGCGMGAATAALAAIDASAQVSNAAGFWRSGVPPQLYPIRRFHKFLACCFLVSLLSVVGPLLAVVAGLLVFPVSFLLGMVGLGLGADASRSVVRWLFDAFEPGALPSILPRLAVVGLLVALVGAMAEGIRARRRSARRQGRGAFWWTSLGALLDSEPAVKHWRLGLWRSMAGGLIGKQPRDADLSSRYAELLAENVGQPGCRELLLVVHDLDARRDLVFALVAERLRRDFFGRRMLGVPPGGGPAAAIAARPRAAEAFDLSGALRDRLVDVLAASLRLPVATDAQEMTFPVEGYWRGETHRLVHRPEAVARLIEEASEAGATQLIVVSASPEPPGPHARGERLADIRSRIGEFISSAEGAAARDAVRSALDASRRIFLIQPGYNPLNALDFNGRYDTLSDRPFGCSELVARGYEDAYKQFIEPVVAAGAEQLGR